MTIVPVLFFLLRTSLFAANPDGSSGAFTWRYFQDIVNGPDFITALVDTLVYAAGAAAIAVAIGAVQAWVAERTDGPGGAVLYLLAFVSLGIPYTLNTIGWLLLLGRAGPVNHMLQALTGQPQMLNVYGLGGMIFIEGLTWAPMAFLMCAAAMRSQDPSLEEAAMTAGGRLPTVLRRVTLPLLRPTFLAVLLLVFTRGLESFEVPALVGTPGRVRVLTTLIYDQIYRQMPPVYGRAAAFALVLVVAVTALLALYARLLGRAERYRVLGGKSFRPRRMALGAWRWPAAAGALSLGLLAVGLPVLMLLWTALLPFYQVPSLRALRLLSFANFARVLEGETLPLVFGDTLVMGLFTGLAATLLGAGIAWTLVRRRAGAVVLDQLAAVPLALPALVLGLAFLQMFLAVPLPLYGSLASLVIASTVAALPYAVRYAHAGLLQLGAELEEAASVCGAGITRILLRIVLPLALPSLAASFLFTFLISVRAMAMLLLISGPDRPVVAVTIFDMWSNGQPGELAALGLLWAGLTALLGCVFFALSRRFGLKLA